MSYGSIDGSAPRRADYKGQAVASILAILGVTLLAASYAGLHANQRVGSTIDLLQIVPTNVPFMRIAQLQQLAQEKKEVGDVLGEDMREMWAAKSKTAQEQDLRQVEAMRNRYDSILAAMATSPALRQFPGPNNEMRAVNPATGQVFQMYEYHVPGGYEDAPLDLDPAVPIFEKNAAGR